MFALLFIKNILIAAFVAVMAYMIYTAYVNYAGYLADPTHYKTHAMEQRFAPACNYEDGSGTDTNQGCYWLGGSFGNQIGRSYFIDSNDNTHYFA